MLLTVTHPCVEQTANVDPVSHGSTVRLEYRIETVGTDGRASEGATSRFRRSLLGGLGSSDGAAKPGVPLGESTLGG
jgi:hypothetical protein